VVVEGLAKNIPTISVANSVFEIQTVQCVHGKS